MKQSQVNDKSKTEKKKRRIAHIRHMLQDKTSKVSFLACIAGMFLFFSPHLTIVSLKRTYLFGHES